ncbi:Pentatricopeptide repeat-containing protein [Abeliophyllum distichum]|uniref:Pentatricopeptide repeat-containing protein n=1 Tax=Abeliophyllum distichum TaxID=126358 RepID=A0ABD1S1W4_9LAMI
MKLLGSIFKTCYAGIKLRSQKFRFFSHMSTALPALSYSQDKDFSSGNDSPCNGKHIADECVEQHDWLVGFGVNHIFNQKATDNDELKRIERTLQNSGWDLGSLGSYKNLNLDEYNIIRILKDLFEENGNASPALYFFIWSHHCMGTKLTVRSISTMIHVLIAGNMNYRAMDLTLCLVRKNDGEDWWLNLLFRLYFETSINRQVLVTAYSMLVNCYVQENMVNMALKLLDEMKSLDIFPSIGVCNSLLGALLRGGEHIDFAWEFLEEIQHQGMGFNVSIINLFLQKYCSDSNLGSGWKLLMEMKHCGISPDIVAYTTVINSLCKQSLWREAVSILFKLSAVGIFIDSVCASSVIHGFCKVGKMEEAFNLMKVFNISPNIFICNSLMSWLCTAGNMIPALNMFHEMSESGLFPDSYCFTTIIRGYCKIRDMNMALSILAKMLKSGIKPSIVTYTILVDCCCKSGDMEMAEYLFQKMPEEGLAPDVVAYNTLMDGFGKKGYLHKVFELLNIMKSSGISPGNVTYNIVIHSLVVRGYAIEAKDLLDELVRRGFSPDIIAFTNIVNGFTKKGNFEEAFLIWLYISETNMKPDVVMCSSILNGFCRVRRMDEAYALFVKMLSMGLIPDLILYNTLIHGFCSIGDFANACHIVNMMTKQDIYPNDGTHKAFALGYEKKRVKNPLEVATCKLQQLVLEYGD